VMAVQFILSVVLYAHFDPAVPGLQAATQVAWIPSWGVSYIIGLDGYNILLVILTTFLATLLNAGPCSALTMAWRSWASLRRSSSFRQTT